FLLTLLSQRSSVWMSGRHSGGEAMRQLKANRSSDEVNGPEFSWMPHTPEASHHRQNELSNSLYTFCDAQFTFATDLSFWRNLRLLTGHQPLSHPHFDRQPLYSIEEKRRRDATPWTLVQGILAPIQFLAFLISLALVLRYLTIGDGFWIATCSIV